MQLDNDKIDVATLGKAVSKIFEKQLDDTLELMRLDERPPFYWFHEEVEELNQAFIDYFKNGDPDDENDPLLENVFNEIADVIATLALVMKHDHINASRIVGQALVKWSKGK